MSTVMNRMTLRPALAGLLTIAAPGLAFASSGGEHGHLTFSDLLHSTEFLGAVVNFALLVFLIRKMAKRPMQSYLDTRQQAVEQGMKEAAELKAKAEAVYKEYTERLKTMDDDIEKLRQDIAQAAEADKQRILAEAEETSQRLRAETDALITRHREELARDVQREVVEAAVAAAEQLLREHTKGDDQARLADSFKASLAATGGRP